MATRPPVRLRQPPTTFPDRATLTSRALGCVLASAAGDALGAPYELNTARQARIPPPPADVPFTSSPDWHKGEWTDDTAMAVPLLEAAAAGSDLRKPAAQSRLVRRWLDWVAAGAKGIGIQTALVMARAKAALDAGGLKDDPGALAELCKAAAKEVHDEKGRSGGNGALMRVGPLALAYLHDAPGLADAARAQALLTHYEADAGDAAALWSLAIRDAILTGRADLRLGLEHLPEERRRVWAQRIDAAEAAAPSDFARNNTWVVSALQCAWASYRVASGTTGTGRRSGEGSRGSVKAVLEAAVRAGGDTDTIGAIAGALAGAVYGVESIPSKWRAALHGWPGIAATELGEMVDQAVGRYYGSFDR